MPFVRHRFPHLLGFVVTLISLIPIFLALVYTLSFRLNVPFRDEWTLNGHIAVLAADNALEIDDLFFVHDGHRAVFTNIVTTLSAVANGWDLRAESLVNFALALLYFTVLLLLFK